MDEDFKVKYTKTNGARELNIQVSAKKPMSMLDILRVLTSIMNQILTTGKY